MVGTEEGGWSGGGLLVDGAEEEFGRGRPVDMRSTDFILYVGSNLPVTSALGKNADKDSKPIREHRDSH